MRLSMHVNDPPSVKKVVSSEWERIIVGALKQVHRDGAHVNDLVHFYLVCAGLDFSFCFNPSGANAVSVSFYFASFFNAQAPYILYLNWFCCNCVIIFFSQFLYFIVKIDFTLFKFKFTLNYRFICQCVSMIYCGLNNNTFKLFLKEHIISLEFNWLFLLLVINCFRDSKARY